MEKSNIIDISTVEQAVKGVVSYVKTWTQSELENVIEQSIKERHPIILNLGKKGYLVGNCAIDLCNKRWWRLRFRFSNQEYLFTNKVSAICFAYYNQIGRHDRADRILKEDDDVARLTIKTEHYYHRYQQAQKKKNVHRTDLFLVRYQESSLRLSASKSLLEKTLKSAKYIKF